MRLRRAHLRGSTRLTLVCVAVSMLVLAMLPTASATAAHRTTAKRTASSTVHRTVARTSTATTTATDTGSMRFSEEYRLFSPGGSSFHFGNEQYALLVQSDPSSSTSAVSLHYAVASISMNNEIYSQTTVNGATCTYDEFETATTAEPLAYPTTPGGGGADLTIPYTPGSDDYGLYFPPVTADVTARITVTPNGCDGQSGTQSFTESVGPGQSVAVAVGTLPDSGTQLDGAADYLSAPDAVGIKASLDLSWGVASGPLPPHPTANDVRRNGPIDGFSTTCSCNDPVNTATGEYWSTVHDVSIPGRGAPLDLARSYSSQDLTAGRFGTGWVDTYAASLSPGATTTTVTESNANTIAFITDGNGHWAPSSLYSATLLQNTDGTWTFTRADGSQLRFSAAGRLTGEADRDNVLTTLAYNADGQLTAITDASGRALVLDYSGAHVSAVTDPLGGTLHYAYDGSGDLTSVTDRAGHVTSYGYDPTGRMTSWTDDRGLTTTIAYDGQGRASSTTDASGYTYSYSYAASSDPVLPVMNTTVTQSDGRTVFYRYIALQLVTHISAPGTPAQAAWSFSTDLATDALTATTDPDGNTSTFTVDASGNRTTATDPLGNVTSSTWDTRHDLLTRTDPLGGVTSYHYDANGNLLTRTDPLGGVTTYHHADTAHPGDVTSVTDPAGRATTYTYTSSGAVATRSVTPTAGVTDTTAFQYNADGELVCAVSAQAHANGITCPVAGTGHTTGTTSASYDADGRTLTTTDPDGHTTTHAYDGIGNTTSLTDPAGNVTTTTYDADSRRLTVTAGAGSAAAVATKYRYEIPAGTAPCAAAVAVTGSVYCNTTQVGAGAATVSAYDAGQRLLAQLDPAGHLTVYSYDAAGNRLSTLDAAGRTTSFAYDDDGDLEQISYSDESTPTVSYTYDANGRRATMDDGTGRTTYAYTADGRLSTVVHGAGNAVRYGYDASGQVTSLRYPDATTVSRTYDNAGRLTSVNDGHSHVTSFAYDADGHLTATRYPNGDTAETTYDPAGETVSSDLTGSAGTLTTLAYTRDADGRLTNEADSGSLTGTTSYAYNALDELTAAGSTNYAYDSTGNVTGFGPVTQTFGPDGRLLTASTGTGTTSYSTDVLGERTALQPAGSSTATVNYGYDEAGRLTAVTQPEPPPTVTGLSPTAGPTGGGTTITITGANLDTATAVTVGGTAATAVTPVSATTLKANVPAGVVGTVDVRVTSSAGMSPVVTGDQFTYQAAPTVTAISPSSGSTAAGTVVTITGTGLIGATKVLFGTVAGTGLTAVTATSATITAPAGSAGVVDVRVVTPSGESAVTTADHYTRDPKPTVKKLSPTTGTTAGGTTVTVTGTGFTGATAVVFGSVAATSFTVVSPTTITAVSPAQAAGKYNVLVTTPGGTSATVTADKFTYAAAAALHHGPAVAIAMPRTEAAGTTATTDYLYDGDGIRTAAVTPAGTTTFTVDDASPAPLLIAAGATDYIYGPDGLPIEQITSGTADYFFHDQLGSTRALTNTAGAIDATYTYSAYGAVTSASGSASTHLTYASGYSDATTGLLYLVARWYDPATGQFLTVDPLLSTTHSPFAYALGDPTNNTDPLGLGFYGFLQSVGTGAGYIAIGTAVVGVLAVGCLTTFCAADGAAIGIAATVAPLAGIVDTSAAAVGTVANVGQAAFDCSGTNHTAQCAADFASAALDAVGASVDARLPEKSLQREVNDLNINTTEAVLPQLTPEC